MNPEPEKVKADTVPQTSQATSEDRIAAFESHLKEMGQMIETMLARKVDVEEIEFRFERSKELNHLFAALAKAQGEFALAERTKRVGFDFKNDPTKRVDYSYADLAILMTASRPFLSKNELCVIQLPSLGTGGIRLITILAHSSGQYIQSFLGLNSPSTDPKALGATVTYARRISYAACVGVVAVDEDQEPDEVDGEAPPQKAAPAPSDKPAKNDKYSKINTGKPVPDPRPKDAVKPAPAAQPRATAPVSEEDLARSEAYATARKAFGDKIDTELPPLLGDKKLKEMSVTEANDLKAAIEVRYEQILDEQTKASF